MLRKTLLAVLAAASGLFGQSGFSSHSGWNFDDTLQTATEIVAADVVRGGGIDNGSQVSARAEIRIVRVLEGSLAPGAEVTVQWTYQPGPIETPAASATIPPVRALWFLRKRGDGAFEPLRAVEPFNSFGGYFVEVPKAPIAYPPEAELQMKVALEIGAALKDLAEQRAADLAPHTPVQPRAGALPDWVRTRNRFHSLTMLLGRLPEKSTAGVYRELSASNEIHARLFGLLGRSASGDPEALCEIEQDLPRLAAAYDTPAFTHRLMDLDLGKNLRAAHCLARMALAEVTLPGLDSMFAMRAGSIRSLEFVPYLVALLASPNPSTRGGALAAFCQVTGLTSPDAAAHCPKSVPVNDPREEQSDIEFWSRWWETQRGELAKTTKLPVIAAPARYAEQPRYQQPVEVPLEIRFQSLLQMATAQATHYHRLGTGEMVNSPPPAHDPVSAAMNDSDREAWLQIVERTNAKLAENDKRSADLRNAARIQGAFPPEEKMMALYRERTEILKAAVQDAQNRLTPEGWQVLLNFMPRAFAGGAMVQSQAPPK